MSVSLTRPNILFIMADQMRFDCLGLENPHIKTPNLDRLAQRGLLMRHAYAPTPVCLPCRASMITGQYPSTHGAMHNMSALPEDHEISLGEVFSRAGYRTHFVGKSHLAPCHGDPLSKETYPFIHNRQWWSAFKGPWYGYEHADLAIGHTVEDHAHGMHYGAWLAEQGVDIERYFGNHEYTDYGVWDLPLEYHNSVWTADRAIAGIDAAVAEGQSFLSWVNFQDPHNPCLVPEPYASMYDPQAIPRFGYKPGEPDCFADKPPHYRDITDQPGAYAAKPSDPDLQAAGNVCHLDWDQDKIQANAACYYGMVTLLDEQVGRILDHLEAQGLADDTLIVFTADHGDLLGDHGLWFKSLVAYDESIRVPMIVSWPRRMAGNRRSDALINLVDLFPSFCHAAGIPIPHQCEGVSQLPTWIDDQPSRDICVVEERPHTGKWLMRVVMDGTWKMAYYPHRDYGELYHHRDDPDHIHNLWHDPDYREVRERLQRALLDHELFKRGPNPNVTGFHRLGRS
ncbi:MAG: sulfatase [Planctomycetota bacterium]|nr:MAG: sulfatase [Planctomycetota bacterium]